MNKRMDEIMGGMNALVKMFQDSRAHDAKERKNQVRLEEEQASVQDNQLRQGSNQTGRELLDAPQPDMRALFEMHHDSCKQLLY